MEKHTSEYFGVYIEKLIKLWKKGIDKWCRCIRSDIVFDNYTFTITYLDATYVRAKKRNAKKRKQKEPNNDTRGRLLEINNRKYQFDKRPARARIMNKEKKYNLFNFVSQWRFV